ncbi:MAG: hypothetical protein KBS62_00975 [Oscillospiraceae bacterium]|nr:hypothetical protein [Candidatus Ruminococcus equi]
MTNVNIVNNFEITSEIKKKGSILIRGNIINNFGVFKFGKKHKNHIPIISNANDMKVFRNAVWLIKALQNKNTIYVASRDIEVEKYIASIIFYAAELGAFEKLHKDESCESVARRYFRCLVKFDKTAYGLDEEIFVKHTHNYKGMKFDTIIQAPQM